MKEEIEVELDRPLLDLVEFCETYCVAGCCGVDAFEITEERIAQWASENGIKAAKQAQKQLQTIILEVSKRDATVTCDRLNACWPTQACVTWLEKWGAALNVTLSKMK